jgi:hypothetical protein
VGEKGRQEIGDIGISNFKNEISKTQTKNQNF